MNQRATQGSKQLQTRRKQQNNYDARLRAKYGAMYDPNKVRQQQQELVKAGYNIEVGVKSHDYQLKKNQQTNKDTDMFTSLTNWVNQFKPKPYLLTRMNRLLQTIKYIVVLLNLIGYQIEIIIN